MAEDEVKGQTAKVCPKCGQEMDWRPDGVWVCGNCGWEIKADERKEKAVDDSDE